MMPGSFVLGPTSAGVGGEAGGGAVGRPRADGRDAQGSPSEAAAEMLAAAEAEAADTAEAAFGSHGNNASPGKPIAE